MSVEFLLYYLVLTPVFIGVLLTLSAVVFRTEGKRWLHFGIPALSFSSLVVAALILVLHVRATGTQYVSSFHPEWISGLGVQILLGFDGWSASLSLLVSVAAFVLALFEWKRERPSAAWLAMVALTEGSALGVLLFKDIFMQVLMYGMGLIPIYFSAAIFSSEKAKEDVWAYARLILNTVGLAALFVVVVILYVTADAHLFDERSFLGHAVPVFNGLSGVRFFGFLLLLVSLVCRIPVWPFQGSYRSYVNSIEPRGLALEVGVAYPAILFLFHRWLFGFFSLEAESFNLVYFAFGILSVGAGAFLFQSRSHLQETASDIVLILSGLYLAGMGSLEQSGSIGAVSLLFTLIPAAMGWLLFLQMQFEREVDGTSLRGLFSVSPRLSLVVGVMMLALAGAPGVSGFVSQSLVLMGSYRVHPGALLALMLFIVIIWGAFLGFYRKHFFGESGKEAKLLDSVAWSEGAALLLLALQSILLGVWPALYLVPIRPAVALYLSIAHGGAP